MDFPTRIACVFCGLFVVGGAPAAAEDVTITYKVAYGEPGSPIRTKYISPGRAEAWSGPDYGFITDAAGKMTRIETMPGHSIPRQLSRKTTPPPGCCNDFQVATRPSKIFQSRSKNSEIAKLLPAGTASTTS